MNYLKILGLSENYTEKELKDNYRNLVKKYHPDISNFDTNDIIKDINLSYSEALSEIKTRKEVKKTIPKRKKNRDIKIEKEITINELLSESNVLVTFNVGNTNDKVNLKLKKGMEYGSTIMFKGVGFQDDPSLNPGNLYVTIIPSRKDRNVEIVDSDIFIDAYIDLMDIIIGDSEIEVSEGYKIKIELSEDNLKDHKLIIEGKGLYDSNLERGNLYIDLYIQKRKYKKEIIDSLKYLRNNL